MTTSNRRPLKTRSMAWWLWNLTKKRTRRPVQGGARPDRRQHLPSRSGLCTRHANKYYIGLAGITTGSLRGLCSGVGRIVGIFRSWPCASLSHSPPPAGATTVHYSGPFSFQQDCGRIFWGRIERLTTRRRAVLDHALQFLAGHRARLADLPDGLLWRASDVRH